MSYCVNCGVELDKTAHSCPLCHTDIYNPNQAVDLISHPPFPRTKGELEILKKRDSAIVTSVVLGSTALSCGLLNLFVFHKGAWSLYIIGACILLWIFSIPFLIYSKLPIYISIFLDGIAATMYCGIIAFQFPGKGWYQGLAVPIIILTTILIEIFAIYFKMFKHSILSKACLFFAEIAVLCSGIELFIDFHFNKPFALSWSAVVLTCCAIIVVTLTTIIKQTRLRNEVRRRAHF